MQCPNPPPQAPAPALLGKLGASCSGVGTRGMLLAPSPFPLHRVHGRLLHSGASQTSGTRSQQLHALKPPTPVPGGGCSDAPTQSHTEGLPWQASHLLSFLPRLPWFALVKQNSSRRKKSAHQGRRKVPDPPIPTTTSLPCPCKGGTQICNAARHLDHMD